MTSALALLAVPAFFVVLLATRPTTTRQPRSLEAVRDWRTDVDRLGIGPFLTSCELLGTPEADPGHPAGMPLALWEAPAHYGPDLVLECHNGTPDPHTGLYARVLLRVPATCTTPVEAAAWTYGVTPDTYRGLTRRT